MFDHCLYFNTTALARRLEREWTEAFSMFGLSPPQAFMLRVILAKPGLLQRELADELSIARPTATRALDLLQTKGLIERRGRDGDGREVCIQPTKNAIAIHAALNKASGTVTSKLKRLLGEAEFGETVSKIRSVRSGLE
ncbi:MULTISPECIES: MarR family transcriptional regulator [unclassified Limnohabitans]|jgi:DNA-binding MarR family transcriptional regulator|uniref:MarR family winged helix-turn-helix transcriptional regulator n=1 Tax=unclassified Limnohabitans TaxID=2626134 RepID=UPI000CF2305F|nr:MULTISPECIES: MarR family transcriptional regulator [unclassified Limnohabitans]PQA79679.1 MarR family transcriptional regulator [Limnohabitans sp. TS-CS-82]